MIRGVPSARLIIIYYFRVRGVAIIASALKSKGKIVMEKVLLSAKQAAELSLEKGYEWFKNQVCKQIRETLLSYHKQTRRLLYLAFHKKHTHMGLFCSQLRHLYFPK